MNLELEIYDTLCATATFTINGKPAEHTEFGEKYDRLPGTTEDHACGYMQFTRNPSTPEVLAKYQINEAEYAIVAGLLEDGLSFGACGWCV